MTSDSTESTDEKSDRERSNSDVGAEWDVTVSESTQQDRATRSRSEIEADKEIWGGISTRSKQAKLTRNNKSSENSVPLATPPGEQHDGQISNFSETGGTNKVAVGDRWMTTDLFGDVSDYWKKAGLVSLLGSVIFVVSFAALLLYPVVESLFVVYLAVAGGLFYFILRILGAYYLYKDAKILAMNATNARLSQRIDMVIGWKPRGLFWTFGMLFPPFAHYGPYVVYLFRRHQYTDVP